jgi:hypothetical protein
MPGCSNAPRFFAPAERLWFGRNHVYQDEQSKRFKKVGDANADLVFTDDHFDRGQFSAPDSFAATGGWESVCMLKRPFHRSNPVALVDQEISKSTISSGS